MIWVWVVALVLVIGAIAVVVAGRDDAMAEVYDDRPDATLPTGRPLTAEDIAAVRLSTGVRGYRMDEVDALLDRIQADLLARETNHTAATTAGTAAEIPADPAAETPAETASGEPADVPTETPAGATVGTSAAPPADATAPTPTEAAAGTRAASQPPS